MASTSPAQTTLDAFLLRSRRVLSHSLISEQAGSMPQLLEGQDVITPAAMKVSDAQSYERSFEEALESLASRVYPLVQASGPIYYAKVLDAVQWLVGDDRLLDYDVDTWWWHRYWGEGIDARAHSAEMCIGDISASDLLRAWLYGDLIGDEYPGMPAIEELTAEEWCDTLAPVVARICDRVIYTHIMIGGLFDQGLLPVGHHFRTGAKAEPGPVRLPEVSAALTAGIPHARDLLPRTSRDARPSDDGADRVVGRNNPPSNAAHGWLSPNLWEDWVDLAERLPLDELEEKIEIFQDDLSHIEYGTTGAFHEWSDEQILAYLRAALARRRSLDR